MTLKMVMSVCGYADGWPGASRSQLVRAVWSKFVDVNGVAL